MKVLIVDDSITMRRIVVNILNSAGYEDVEEAGNGSEALSKLAGVGLVLTDWNMPGMDGLTFVREVRKSLEYANLPILMVTTEGTKESVLEALKAGVNDYIVKPFTKATLMEKISGIIKS